MLTVRGARENNLAAIDLDLDLGTLIVFTGPSGSGKTSLALDTLHQEGQRRYLEALAVHHRPGLDLRRPAVDTIGGLPPTLALEQGGGSGDARETIGTATDALALLGVVFARAGVQHCPSCGQAIRPRSHDEIVGSLLALPEGTRLTLEAPVRKSGRGVLDEVVRAGFSRVRIGGEVRRVEEITAAEAEAADDLRVVVDRIRIEAARRDRIDDTIRTTARAGRGVVVASTDDDERVFVDRPYCWECDRALPALEPRLFNARSPSGQCPTCRGLGADAAGAVCPDCAGTRLREEARHVRWDGATLPDLTGLRLDGLRERLDRAERTTVVADALDEVGRRVDVLVDLGLGYLDLGRATDALSTGERQRLRLAAQLGARLSGVLYVLDEPGAGLHPGEVDAVVRVLRALRDAGNTVIAVEHHPAVIAAADRVVDFGPGPGARGGRVVFDGTVADLRVADTATGRWLSGRERLPAPGPVAGGPVVRVRGASDRNLRDVDVDLPTGGIVALHGPSGSGKSALLDTLRHHAARALGGDPPRLPSGDVAGLDVFARLVEVEAGGPNRSPRSSPATYVGAWDIVRELLAATSEARVRGMEAGFFSLARPGGRCEACKGTGFRRVDLGFLPDVYLPCDVCDGRRFAADVLEVRWKGLDPDALLRLRADEAHAFLAGHPRLEASLRALVDVGLGYVPLGQPGHTLSGGEAQRLRLARELARANRAGGERVLYVLDDPTVGLHPADVAALLALLRRLVAEGGTVWLATHDDALAAACDAVVRVGPGGGPEGGRVLP